MITMERFLRPAPPLRPLRALPDARMMTKPWSVPVAHHHDLPPVSRGGMTRLQRAREFEGNGVCCA